MDFEKSPKNGQISPKSKGVNLNFLTILLKRLKKASSGLIKRFQLGLRFIGRIILEKIDFQKRPPQRSKGVDLNILTILDQTRIMHLSKYQKPLSLFSHTPEVMTHWILQREMYKILIFPLAFGALILQPSAQSARISI